MSGRASQSNALFLGTPEDKSYLPYLKGMFSGAPTYIVLEPITMLAQLEMYCDRKFITRVVSTNTDILLKLLERAGSTKKSVSLDDYAGSLFSYRHLEIVFVPPLKQLFTVSYGKFLCQRYISKVIVPENWIESTQFHWELLNPNNIFDYYESFKTALVIAIDIETFKQPLSIRCISYCGLFIGSDGRFTTKSIVLPLDSEWALEWTRKFNDIEPPKVFQNGKYDNSYLLRYNAPVRNWFWDTAHLFHSWYSELPKDLAFLNAFFLRKVVYWKDLAETSDLYEYYRYNAMDSWATINVFIGWMLSAPDWARKNYTLEFPLVYPCLLAEMTGIKRDQGRLEQNRKILDDRIESKLEILRKCLGTPTFNPSSPKQVIQLLKVLGLKDITSSDEKSLKKAAYLHPLNAILCGLILDIRGFRKLITTYLRLDSDSDSKGSGGAKEFNGTILYALNPQATDTGRLASKEHHFWTGLQIQNIPSREGSEVKQTLCAAEGFYIGECDLSQAESRDTAYIAGEVKLIEAVSGTKDFHSINASAFFGTPYESIYDDSTGKVKNKSLRDLAKRVNHGANYNMGPGVLVDTMGMENIWNAKKLLKLPFYEPKEIATYLLDRFHETYPRLRGSTLPFSAGTYYASVAYEITTHKRITSRAYHHTAYNISNYKSDQYIGEGDWTRYCFGDPIKNKSDLNAYVAHGPQSLNARTLNEAWMKVFYEIALKFPHSFRLHAQIHDSILFSYKPISSWHEDEIRFNGRHGKYTSLPDAVRACMEIPVTVRDVFGVNRTFTVPAALKLGKMKGNVLVRAKYWSDTE